MKLKRFFAAFTAVATAALMLTGCGSKGIDANHAGMTVNVMALKGPTAMGLVSMMNDADTGAITDIDYNFEIAGAADEVTPAIVQGNCDIAALPANLASVLYSKTEGEVEVLAINTLGVIYIVENGESVNSVADLKGQTIYASGKGATPEYALNYILENNGINPETDVDIQWMTEHTECLAALTENENAIAMLPQPFVTVASTKVENLRVAIDFNEEWDKIGGDSSMLTGVVVARKAFVDEYPDVVEDFMSRYEASVKFTNENVDEAAALVGSYDIVAEPVAKQAIPKCNIVFISGNDMKTKLSGYLQTLMDANPQAVGGALPGDDFYYGVK